MVFSEKARLTETIVTIATSQRLSKVYRIPIRPFYSWPAILRTFLT